MPHIEEIKDDLETLKEIITEDDANAAIRFTEEIKEFCQKN